VNGRGVISYPPPITLSCDPSGWEAVRYCVL